MFVESVHAREAVFRKYIHCVELKVRQDPGFKSVMCHSRVDGSLLTRILTKCTSSWLLRLFQICRAVRGDGGASISWIRRERTMSEFKACSARARSEERGIEFGACPCRGTHGVGCIQGPPINAKIHISFVINSY